MKVIIQSFSDIITNSSSEVFVSTKNDDLIKALDQLGIYYYSYEDEESLRKAVEDNAWDFNEFVSYNPYNEWWFDELKANKTSDELWEFFKSFYTDLIGKIVVEVDRDYLYAKEREKNIYLGNYIKE